MGAGGPGSEEVVGAGGECECERSEGAGVVGRCAPDGVDEAAFAGRVRERAELQ